MNLLRKYLNSEYGKCTVINELMFRNFNAFESFLVPQLSPTVALGLQILLLLPHPRPRLGAGWLIGGLLVPWLRRAGTTRNTCFQGTTLSLGLTRIHIPAVRRNSSQPSLRCSVFNATLQPQIHPNSSPPMLQLFALRITGVVTHPACYCCRIRPPSNLRLQVTPLTRRTDFI